MKRCLVTYQPFEGAGDYSPEGLKKIDNKLVTLRRLTFSAEEQRQEAVARAGKMSIQGIQPKLSAVLKVNDGCFELVDHFGRFIFKPQIAEYSEVPQNEDLTMHLAATVDIPVPPHGLIYGSDNTLTYFIRRFDRPGRSKLAVEDFAQLSGGTRDTKYESSMEKVAGIVDQFCTFPVIEYVSLFTRVLFNFLVGNEDMHLKNYALITRKEKVELAPAFDFLNTSIAIKNPREEIALPLGGKKSGLTKSALLDYYPKERLGLNEATLNDVLDRFRKVLPTWNDWIGRSFLSPVMQENYRNILSERRGRLGI